MADDVSHVAKTVDDMKRQVVAKLESARSDIETINALETRFGLPLTVFDELASIESAPQPPAPANQKTQSPLPRRSNPQQLRPDEYLGEEPMEAAKSYMRSVGHAIHFDEIADAVQRGGAAISGAGWRDRLELSLKRSPYQVITVAEKTYGLADFYTEEQLNRLRSTRRREPTPTPKKKATPNRKKKQSASPKKTASKTKAASEKKTETGSADD